MLRHIHRRGLDKPVLNALFVSYLTFPTLFPLHFLYLSSEQHNYLRQQMDSVGAANLNLLNQIERNVFKHIRKNTNLTAALVDRPIEKVLVSHDKVIDITFRFRDEFELIHEVCSHA